MDPWLNNLSSTEAFCVLSTCDCPLLEYTVEYALQCGFQNIVLILDEKGFSDKDQEIWSERTGGYFDRYINGRTQAWDNRVTTYFVSNHNSIDCISVIMNLDIKCGINAGTPRKLSKELLNCFDLGVINVHPGLIPEFRGSCAPEWSILENFPICNTVHIMDEDYDSGSQIYVDVYVFETGVSYQQIRSYIHKRAIELSVQFFSQIISDNCVDKELTNHEKFVVRKPIGKVELDKAIEIISNNSYFKPKFIDPLKLSNTDTKGYMK